MGNLTFQSHRLSRLAAFIGMLLIFAAVCLITQPSPVYAATIVVTGTDGTINGVDGVCSISEAIQNANNDSLTHANCLLAGSGADTIQLSANVTLFGSVDTTDGSNGTPSVTTAITLDGMGYGLTRNDSPTCVSTQDSTNDASEFRLLHVGTTGNLTLQNIAIEHGCADGGFPDLHGGGIFNRGTLSINNSTLDGNRARSFGGGLYNNGGTVTALTEITVSNNTANSGGGLYNYGGTIAQITNSTFSSNEAITGAALLTTDAGTITAIQNSTFSGNAVGGVGRGAIEVIDSGIIFSLRNTIITGTDSVIPGTDIVADCFVISGTISAGNNNLADNNSSGACPGDAGDVSNFDTTLADNGCTSPGPNGCVKTHALLAGSTAINTSGGAATSDDQRGFGLYAARDIGAFERQRFDYVDCSAALRAGGFTTTVSSADGLRQAVVCANYNGPLPDTIQQTADILFTDSADSTDGSNALPSVVVPMILDGMGYGLARDDSSTCVSTQDGTNDSSEFRLLHVGATGNLTLQNIAIEHGCADGGTGPDDDGGGIFNRGTLSINNSTLDGNRAKQDGGALYNSSGTLTALTDSTVSNNTAFDGGGIRDATGTIDLISNTTFSGNTGTTFTGALITIGGIITTIENSTFSGNSGNAGGIENISGTIGTLRNTIITGSTGNDCSGTISAGNNNLADNNSSGACPGDAGDVSNFDTTLADNGCTGPGPNGCVKTHALLAGSNAIDMAGTGATSNDQRGLALNSARDIGAVERQVVEFVDCTPAQKTDGSTDTAGTAAGMRQAVACANYNGPLPDTIQQTADILFTDSADSTDGSNALPSVVAPMILDGMGYGLARDDSSTCVSTQDGTNDSSEFRLLHVGTTGNLTLQNIAIEHGCADGGTTVPDDDGGGIFNRGTLSITNSTLGGNRAEQDGGALYNSSGTLTALTDSTVSNNTAAVAGGIVNNGTVTLISNSTFSGNDGTSTLSGVGAINNAGTLGNVQNSTFSGNESGTSGYAAGIDNVGTFANLSYTIITGSITGPDCYGCSTGSGNYCSGVTCPNNVAGVTNFDAVLKDNGCVTPGPNGCVKTHALLENSNAIDSAGVGATTTDQRGYNAFNGRDVGAWESADQDSDNLGEADEVAAGTDPYYPDSDGDGLNDGDEVAATTDPLEPDTDSDGIRDGLDPGPALIDSSDDNFIQCEDVSDASPSTIMKNTMIQDLVLCADPDGIIVGEGDPTSPVQVTGTGELITITPGSTEYKGPFKVSTEGKVRQLTEPIPTPPLPP